MSKIAVGEKVVIRSDIRNGDRFDEVQVNDSMQRYLGKEVTVYQVDVLGDEKLFTIAAAPLIIFSVDMLEDDTVREAKVDDLYVYIHKHGGKPMLFERELTERESYGNDLKFVMKFESGEVEKVIREMMANIERTLKDLFGE